MQMPAEVLRVADVGLEALRQLLAPYALRLIELPAGAQIPGSYWGESEAGLVADSLYARADTPVHSVLHEAAHFVCMDRSRRERLDKDAGGDHAEENAVCYLQILWADALAGVGREGMWRDMDAWGYTFRLGSARRWFEEDAEEAREWLERFGIIDARGNFTGELRVES
jgi:hypothetical protein